MVRVCPFKPGSIKKINNNNSVAILISERFLIGLLSVDNMALKGLLAESLSRYKGIDAVEELRISLKPFWIYRVMAVSNFYPARFEKDLLI